MLALLRWRARRWTRPWRSWSRRRHDPCRSAAGPRGRWRYFLPYLFFEAHPTPIEQTFMRQVASFVFHAAAAGDVETQIQIRELPFSADLQLLQDGIGADAQISLARIVTAVHRRQSVVTAIADGDADEGLVAVIAELERVTTRGNQEIAVAIFVDGRLTITQVSFALVNIVQLHA